jgi:hypothetical protein
MSALTSLSAAAETCRDRSASSGMSFYLPPPGGYPDGPEACEEADGCSPLVGGFGELPAATFFGLLAACALLIVVAVCAHKLKLGGGGGGGGSMLVEASDGGSAPPLTPPRQSRDEGLERALLVGQTGGTQGATPHKPPSEPERPHRDSVAELDGAQGGRLRRFEGFRTSLLGSSGLLGLWLISLALVFLYVVLLVDYYSGCQLRGPDAACFYGTYRIFGGYDTNSFVFLGLWCTSLCWVLALFAAGGSRRNLFRSPCALYEADWVQVTIVEDELLLGGQAAAEGPHNMHAAGASRCVSRYHRWLCRPVEGARRLTVPVQQLGDDSSSSSSSSGGVEASGGGGGGGRVRFIVVESTRYMLDPRSGRPRRAQLRIGLSVDEIQVRTTGLDRLRHPLSCVLCPVPSTLCVLTL